MMFDFHAVVGVLANNTSLDAKQGFCSISWHRAPPLVVGVPPDDFHKLGVIFDNMFTAYATALEPHAIFGHVKTNNRFISLIQTLGENFGKSIPRSCTSAAETQAIYHFMNSPRVSHESILLSERDRVLDLVSSSSEDMIISVGDVSTLTYSTNRSSGEMGFVGSGNQHGFRMLSQLICYSDGVPLGLLSQYMWNYTAKELGKRRERQNLPIEEKESGYYLRQIDHLHEHFGDQPARRLLHLFDRAGDIHELLQSRQYEHIHYIIRSKNDRKVLNSDQTIRQFLDQEPVAGCYTIKLRSKPKSVKGQARIEKQRARKGDWRTANLEVSYGKVVLMASNKTKNRPLKPVEVYLVRALEVDAPPDVETIDWVLLTSLPVENLSDAFKIIDYYIIRWQIEVFHYVLKQGAQVEQLQLDDPQAVLNAIAVYSLLAVQVQQLRYLAERQPDKPVEQAGYTIQDYQMMATYLNSTRGLNFDPHKQKVTIAEFALLISILGGNHKRKKIGVISIWHGLRDFKVIQDAYRVFSSA